jgi:hypothetical protein
MNDLQRISLDKPAKKAMKFERFGGLNSHFSGKTRPKWPLL